MNNEKKIIIILSIKNVIEKNKSLIFREKSNFIKKKTKNELKKLCKATFKNDFTAKNTRQFSTIISKIPNPRKSRKGLPSTSPGPLFVKAFDRTIDPSLIRSRPTSQFYPDEPWTKNYDIVLESLEKITTSLTPNKSPYMITKNTHGIDLPKFRKKIDKAPCEFDNRLGQYIVTFKYYDLNYRERTFVMCYEGWFDAYEFVVKELRKSKEYKKHQELKPIPEVSRPVRLVLLPPTNRQRNKLLFPRVSTQKEWFEEKESNLCEILGATFIVLTVLPLIIDLLQNFLF